MSDLKRYGVLFTCLASRAIHLETVISLTTDSFINALRHCHSEFRPPRFGTPGTNLLADLDPLYYSFFLTVYRTELDFGSEKLEEET